MFSSQSFGAASQAAAGGLMLGTPDAKRAKVEEKNTCLPVTVRMVEAAMGNRSDDGTVYFHGTEPGMLVLVGVIESLSQQATGIEFSLNDATGRMRARYFTSGPEVDLGGFVAGRYVSLAAQLRTSPSAHLSVTSMQFVQSADELSFHMIEAAHAALKLQAPPSTSSALRTPEKLPAPPKRDTVIAPPEVPAVSLAPTPAKAVQALQGGALQAAVLNFLKEKSESCEEGVLLGEICSKMAPAGKSEIVAILQQLVSDGEAFNTIDDDHFSAL